MGELGPQDRLLLCIDVKQMLDPSQKAELYCRGAGTAGLGTPICSEVVTCCPESNGFCCVTAAVLPDCCVSPLIRCATERRDACLARGVSLDPIDADDCAQFVATPIECLDVTVGEYTACALARGRQAVEVLAAPPGAKDISVEPPECAALPPDCHDALAARPDLY
jgi:hypothetical protein